MSEMESTGHQLSPECRDIAQLPIARKLQGFKVGWFDSKSDPKTKTRNLDQLHLAFVKQPALIQHAAAEPLPSRDPEQIPADSPRVFRRT